MNPVATALPHSMLPQPAVMETKPMKKCLWQRQVLNKSVKSNTSATNWSLVIPTGICWRSADEPGTCCRWYMYIYVYIYIHNNIISLLWKKTCSITLSPRLRGYHCTNPPRRTSWWWDRPKWKLWCHLWQPTAWCSWPPELPWHQWHSRAFLGWSPGWSHTSRTTGQRFPAWAVETGWNRLKLNLQWS